jgi:hypothetical protein
LHLLPNNSSGNPAEQGTPRGGSEAPGPKARQGPPLKPSLKPPLKALAAQRGKSATAPSSSSFDDPGWPAGVAGAGRGFSAEGKFRSVAPVRLQVAQQKALDMLAALPDFPDLHRLRKDTGKGAPLGETTGAGAQGRSPTKGSTTKGKGASMALTR